MDYKNTNSITAFKLFCWRQLLSELNPQSLSNLQVHIAQRRSSTCPQRVVQRVKYVTWNKLLAQVP